MPAPLADYSLDGWTIMVKPPPVSAASKAVASWKRQQQQQLDQMRVGVARASALRFRVTEGPRVAFIDSSVLAAVGSNATGMGAMLAELVERSRPVEGGVRPGMVGVVLAMLAAFSAAATPTGGLTAPPPSPISITLVERVELSEADHDQSWRASASFAHEFDFVRA